MKTNSNASNQSYKIAVRFGDAILQAGHTAVPNLALNHYAQLDISHAEMMFSIHIRQYWWSEQDPYPALGTIAEKMGVSTRQARNYARSLRQKGFLEVQERYVAGLGQITSEYNFGPLIAAITKRASTERATPRNNRAGEGWKDSSELPRKAPAAEEDTEQEDTHSIGSKVESAARKGHAALRDVHPSGPKARSTGVPERAGAIMTRHSALARNQEGPRDEARQAIRAHLASLREEFGDRAPAAASERRTLNLYQSANIDLATFIGQLYQARSLTRAQVVQARANNRPRRPMAYFFAVFEQILDLAKTPIPR